MTLEERVGRTLNRLAVVERMLALEGLDAADVIPPMDALSIQAGIHELIYDAWETLEPVTHAPGEIANWEPVEGGAGSDLRLVPTGPDAEGRA